MTGPPAATAAVRVAVRRCLSDLAPSASVAAAVSGGADSLALAAALAFERPGSAALVVDHRLQPGSADVARRAAEQCTGLGLTARVLAAPAAGRGTSCAHAGPGRPGRSPSPSAGPEAAARTVRYALLDDAARNLQLAAVLLGHTLDDQAETVLLALGRGSGTRSLAGMPPRRGIYRRPLLELERQTVRAACAQARLQPVEDPHNSDPSYARARVRGTALPALEAALGPGVAQALARTAGLLRQDADTLDALTPDLPEDPSCAELAALPQGLRSRALKRWAERSCATAVTSTHVDALDALVQDWHGQGPVALPGGVVAQRRQGRLVAQRAPRRRST